MTHVNLMNFYQAKCKILHLGQGNPKHEHGLGNEWIGSSPIEEDLGRLLNEKLNMSRQHVLAVQKANCFLSCIKRSVISRDREGICPPVLS